MSTGKDQDKKQLTAPSLTISRSSSSSPDPHSKTSPRSVPIRAKSESSRADKLSPLVTRSVSIRAKSESTSLNKLSPLVTRASLKKKVSASKMALNDFIATTDRISQFASKINTPTEEPVTVFTLQVRRDQFRSLWQSVDQEYKLCCKALSQEASSSDITTMQAKYEYCYAVYEGSASLLDEQIKKKTTENSSQGCNLPPCDTEVFSGDYLRWPTFRDLFTAVYINNSRLTPVEKLFHLNAKTSGEAKSIVSKSPLTNDGFQSAWKTLTDRYENKRLLVNSQLKVLFNVQAATQESGAFLKNLQSSIQGCLTALALAEVKTENWDCLLVFLCTSKLPKSTLAKWENSLQNKTDIPTWDEFNNFLTVRYRTLEAVEEMHPSSSTQVQAKFAKNESTSKRINSFENKISVQSQSCKLCAKENHPIRLCPKFLQMPVSERSNYIRQLKLCLNCFGRGHQLKDCTSAYNCNTCKGRHNTLLHRGGPPQVLSAVSTAHIDLNTPQSEIQSASSFQSQNVQNYFAANTQGVLLGTAMIDVCHLGTKFRARALIDSGSEATFITERMFKIIKLPFKSVQAQVSGLNQAIAAQPHKLCHFHIGSPIRPRIQIEASAFVLPHLAGNLPSYTIPQSSLTNLPSLQLADPSFYESSQIDVLIGADILPSILLGGSRSKICGTLLGQETIFGWILTGPIAKTKSKAISSFSTQIVVSPDANLEQLLTKFWEVEDVPMKILQPSEADCEKNFIETTTRNEEGRYVVTLPFRNPNHIDLGHSRSIALAQFLKNESRLKRNLPLKKQYDSVIQEYLDLGHMHRVSPNDQQNNFYLPHHAVFKPDSTTTQVRVVFNASNPSSNGISLNDTLHQGPTLQSDLTLQILKWRFFRFVFNADITKMYRQILVHQKHTPYQRILFRNKEGEITDYELNTVTFGVTCAPFLAIRVLQQLAQDVNARYPLASNILSSSMYVDDVLAGMHTKQCAISAVSELRLALASAGFPLRKWTSNSKAILGDIPREHLLCADFLELEEASTAKTLGIRWQAKSDEFFFAPSHPPSKQSCTKREVLSEISKLFDPAGWLAPFIVRAKIFMQEIWLHELGWDTPLPVELIRKWHDFLQDYPILREIRIPRWVQFGPKGKFQYHGFCDASQRAYGAAIYVRSETEHQVSVHLLMAKTRVAPTKTVSLPRLELCGAVLLAELYAAIVPQMPAVEFDSYFWTDSTIVLAWLSRPPCKWTTFVANRVAKIRESAEAENWSHVRSEQNPADLASRGVAAQDLVGNSLWWTGPEWLQLPKDQWPLSEESVQETELELRAVKCNVSQLPPNHDILDRFSKFQKAVRVTAYVSRFLKRCRKTATHNTVELSSKEISEAQELLIVSTQRREYSEEYKTLLNQKQLPKSSSLRNLNPFLDQNGVLRSCGRVRASESLSYDEKHPIILPYACQFSRLLVRFTHDISLHGGNQLIMRLIRSKFWIPKLKVLVKSTINSCKACLIHRKRLQTQLMGELPRQRVTFSRPFTNTGVDFAGPFEIKSYMGRACRITKGYVCVFVCFSTKAIHLEATSDLTTEKFLAAFSRFVARRGCPQQMCSDNGKTFVGASKALSRDFLEATRALILSKHGHQNLSWRFNPPSAPHMGGLWEAGVKSFKTLFYRSTSSFKYTFEELSTLLSKIESCLNSRPISPMSEDPTDLLALTPGHFLVGGPLLAVSEPEINENVMSILNRWQRLKALNQQFCFRWKDEYLKELHKRNKWQTPTRNLQVDDMVIIKEDNVPTNEWRLGRIQSTSPGTDHKVRVVDVLTTRGVIRRPVAKLILLPAEPNMQDSSI